MTTCAVCQGTEALSDMTDGQTHHTLCQECRELVTTLFYIHGTMSVAVMESTRAKRGRRETGDADWVFWN